MPVGLKSALILFPLVVVVSLLSTQDVATVEGYIADEGVMDLRNWEPTDRTMVSLNGQWAFYWNRVADEKTGAVQGNPDHYARVPAYWDHLSDADPRISAWGAATYELDILVPPGDELFALKLLNLTPNGEVFINGVRKAEMGNVHVDDRLSVSGNRPMIIPVDSVDGRVKVTISISNYHNNRGGLNREISFGTFPAIRLSRTRNLAIDAYHLGGLFLMAIYQLSLFLLHPRRRAPLFMAALSLLAFFFAGFKHEMVLVSFVPGWDGEIRTTFIYLTLALAPAVFTYYAGNLYPAHLSKWTNRAIAVLSMAFSLIILATSKAFFTRLLMPLEILVGVAAIYNVIMLVRGYLRSRDSQILMYLAGLLFLLVCIGLGMLDNAIAGIVEGVAGIFFLFVLYQAFLQAYIYSYAFREIDHLSSQKAKLEKRNVELFSLSYIDSLTGTCNRRLFDDYLASNWRVSALSGKSIGMILLDLDNFKDYNEFYGHRKGDLCLTRVCELIREQMNHLGQDTLARYGGEEFAIIVTDMTGNELYELAETLRKAVETGGIEHRSSSTGQVVTISLGCAVLVPTIEADPETLIDAADMALHQAKAEGRNRTVLKGVGSAWQPRLV